MARIASGYVTLAQSNVDVIVTDHDLADIRAKRHGKPDTIVTDDLNSYPAAMKKLGNQHRCKMGRWLNSRTEIKNGRSASTAKKESGKAVIARRVGSLCVSCIESTK